MRIDVTLSILIAGTIVIGLSEIVVIQLQMPVQGR